MSVERRLPDLVRAGSYNTLYLFEDHGPAGREHYQLVAETIREMDADILAVQEIRAPAPEVAAERLRQLAADAGMNCLVPAAGGGPHDRPGPGAGASRRRPEPGGGRNRRPGFPRRTDVARRNRAGPRLAAQLRRG